jgi:DNA-binding transcriptional MerR regulator
VDSAPLSIGDLADAAGLSRRAIRFYVQQRLLPPPLGRGRGRHYDRSHVERLNRIVRLQSAGHSLDAIRRILDSGGATVPPPQIPARRPPRASLSARLWTRLSFGDGVELHFDAARHNPTVEQLTQLRDAVRSILDGDGGSNETSDAHASDTPGGPS